MNMKKGFKNSEIRRLILAKKLYLHGYSHATNKDVVSRMLAIHNFDNAVEIVLKCVATKCQLKPKGKYFYFQELIEKIRTLPLRDQIKGLHDARNMVQHQGDIPDLEVVTKYKGYVEDFFRELVQKEFGVSYDKLYLSLLIENDKLREKILESESAFEKREYKRCIELCDDALISATFEEADLFYTAGVLTGYWGTAKEFENVISKDYIEKYKEKDFYEPVKELSRAILQLGQAATGMQFLDEYRIDFLKHRRVVETLEEVSNNELKENAEFSLNFVTNLILKWQEEGIFRNEQCVEE